MKAFRILLLPLAVFTLESFAVNGVAVSTAKRNTQPINKILTPEVLIGSAGRQGNMDSPGKTVRTYIKNSRIDRVDTLLSNEFTRYPTLSFDGKMVAFFRYGVSLHNGALINAGAPCHIAVMDIDGNNVRNLAEVQENGHCSIDWPAGDWIYYQKTGSFEIRKVNYKDGSTDRHVYTYPESFRKWEMSASGKYAIIQYNEGSGNANLPHKFPPPAPVIRELWANDKCSISCNKCIVGCNAIMSPVGMMMGHFSNSSHSYIRINEWAPPVECLSSRDVKITEMESWLGESIGGSMDWPRWSSNSEKWVCLLVGPIINACNKGGNQFLLNWKDKEIIRLSHNPTWTDTVPPNTIIYFNTAGDFHIYGPADCYEDTLGRWINVYNGTQNTSAIIKNGNAGFQWNGNSSAALSRNIFDLQGRSRIQKSFDGTKKNLILLIRENNVKVPIVHIGNQVSK